MKYVTVFLVVILLLLNSCKTSTEPETKVETPIKDTLIVRYDSLATFPYSQTLMIAGYSDRIYIYGSYGKYSVYYIENKTIVHFSTVNDTISWRWDGAFVTVEDMMYIIAIAIGNRSDYQKVLTFNPKTYEIKPTSTTNPFTIHMYPAAAATSDKIMILFPTSDSLYVFNTISMTGQFVSKNQLKNQFNEKIYSSGIYEGSFYIYSKTVKQLFKINTQTYNWDEIIIPDSIKSIIDQYALGGIVGNKLCLFNKRNNSKPIVAYNMATRKWLVGVSNSTMDISEPYFYSLNNELYIAEVFSKKLWKVSLTN